jgi:DHA2 family multidrug resistance protein
MASDTARGDPLRCGFRPDPRGAAPSRAARIESMAGVFLGQAGNLEQARMMAIAQLQAMVRREAYVMAYSDCFWIMGVVLVLSVLAIFFMRKPPAGPAAAH